LAIGLGYNATGPARPNASLSWQGQQGSSWGDTIMGGVDLVFLDTDGSDSIEMADTLGISVNYSLSHPQKGGSGSGGAGDPLLFFSQPNGPAGPGDTLQINIFLGTDTLPADSVYGIAFSVTYDNALVDTNTAHFQIPDSSWLGSHYSDLFSVQHDNYDDGLIDVGISRNDHISRTSHGKIARLDIIMIDDITAKKNIVDTLTLTFEEIYIIRLDGSLIPVNALSVDSPGTDGTSTGIPDLHPEEDFSLYPNPTRGMFRLRAEKEGPYTLELFNASGQLLQSGTMYSRSMSLDLSQHSPGLYLLRIRHEQGILTRKIQLTH
jgi:hypothetical protein